jgi:hypothetical protein
MKRRILIGLAGLLVSIGFASTARSAASAPTTQPSLERENQLLRAQVQDLQQEVTRLRKQLAEAKRSPALEFKVPTQPFPNFRSGLTITPGAKIPSNWILQNENTNVWHYLVPVGDEMTTVQPARPR